jgi:ABC-type Fe3+/spermidine/putrescine transport system ATPase subunit
LDSIVRLERLVERFGDIAAVDDVSIDIQQSEFLTLLGPSGSSKV